MHDSEPLITIDSRVPQHMRDLDDVRRALGLHPPSHEQVQPDELRLMLQEDHLEIWDETSRRRGFRVDFSGIDTRTGSGGLSRHQPLGRAVGGREARRSGTSFSVIDATAGFGHDAFLLACMGHMVEAIERNPVIHFLLESSINHAARDPELSSAMGDRLRCVHADSTLLLREHDPVDVVYLDPMFGTDTHGSALPKKKAQLLRRLAGPPAGDRELFEAAITCSRRRVVVKRTNSDEPLAPDPDLQISGKIARYDIYLTGTGT